MKRREFITLLGGAAVWPVAARAQQAGKVPTIGFLGESTSAGQREWVAAFVQRLRELGWAEGRNVAIEYRWAEGLARPGGNATGLTNQTVDLAGKRIELLREIVPGLRQLAVMANVDNPSVALDIREVEATGRDAWPRSRYIGNPASRRHRARHRGAPGATHRRFMWLAIRS